MEFPLLVRFHLYIESDPRFCIITDSSFVLLQDIPVYLMRATRGICAAAARRARAAAREARKNAGPPNENVSHSGSHCRGYYSGALSLENHFNLIPSLIARFMGPTWGPSGADRTQVGPCWPHELCYLGWINARLQYFQCVTNGDAEVLYLAIDLKIDCIHQFNLLLPFKLVPVTLQR